MSDDNNRLDIGALQAQTQANTRDIGEIKSTLNTLSAEFRTGFAAIDERLGRAVSRLTEQQGQTFRPMAAWATLVLLIVSLVGSLVGFFGIRGYESMLRNDDKIEQQILALDTKLQKEFQLAIDATDREVETFDKMSRERQDETRSRVADLREFTVSQIKADLDELRQRRRGEKDALR